MEALGVDYAWLQEQLAELSAQLNSVGLEDDFEDEYEEWEDPSSGLLTEVFEACEGDNADALGPLLEKLGGTQWSLSTHGPDGDTPLHTAALFGSEECVKLLLAAGARVDVLNAEDGTSVLHDAAAGGYATIMRLLVDAARGQLGAAAADDEQQPEPQPEPQAGAGAEAEPQAGTETGAETEAEQQQQQQPETLGKAGEEGGEAEGAAAPRPVAPPPKSLAELLNLQDSEGETALHNAARGNHVEAVRLLLSLGADPTVAANDGSLPADEPEDEGVAAILLQAAGGGSGGEGEEEEGEEEEEGGEEADAEEGKAASPAAASADP